MPAETVSVIGNNIEITPETVIPWKYRVVGPRKIMWLLNIPPAYVSILPLARDLDGHVMPNKYDIVACVQALLQNPEVRRANSSVAQLELARVNKIKADIEKVTLQNEILKGSICRKEDVDAEVTDMIMAIRSKLLGFPAHVARLILGKENYEEVVKILTDLMETTLAELKNIDFDAVRARNRKLAMIDASNDEVEEENAS